MTARDHQRQRTYAAERTHEKAFEAGVLQARLVGPYQYPARIDGEANRDHWARAKKAKAAHRAEVRRKVRVLVDAITATDWWQESTTLRTVTTSTTAPNARCSTGGMFANGWGVRINPNGERPYVVLHELAHVLSIHAAHRAYFAAEREWQETAGSRRPPHEYRAWPGMNHDPVWRAWLVELVRLCSGDYEADTLAATFTAAGLRVGTAPRAGERQVEILALAPRVSVPPFAARAAKPVADDVAARRSAAARKAWATRRAQQEAGR